MSRLKIEFDQGNNSLWNQTLLIMWQHVTEILIMIVDPIEKSCTTGHRSLVYNHSLLVRSLFCPPRIREICKPLLKAWLKSILVWNSETNGNHAKKATGVKSSKPIITSYPRASARTEPQSTVLAMSGLQACAIFTK